MEDGSGLPLWKREGGLVFPAPLSFRGQWLRGPGPLGSLYWGSSGPLRDHCKVYFTPLKYAESSLNP
jgi:hypothetical protein